MAARFSVVNFENVCPQPAFRRRSSKRSFASICDENGEPSMPCFSSQRRLSEPTPAPTKASARRSRGLSDITNGFSDLCLDLKPAEPMQCPARRASDVEMGVAERPLESRRPALPATLIAKILAFAGLAAEPLEAEYAGRLLIRERQREPRFLAMFGWRAELDARDRMRATVVDWLQEVHRDCGLRPRTLFLSVNLLDRFLERRALGLERIQLAAAAALLVASKVDEVRALKVRTIVWLCADAYSAADVRECERAVLAALSFQVEAPTVCEFLPLYLAACQAEANLGRLDACVADGDLARCALRFGGRASARERRRNETAWELCARALLDAELCRRQPPSLFAAAAVLASNMVHGSRPWPQAAEALSAYSEAALAPCAEAMLCLRDPDTAPEYLCELVGPSRPGSWAFAANL